MTDNKKIYGRNDGMVVFSATGHGMYQTTPEALDLAFRYWSDATVNDLQWVMLERNDYELTYWDITAKSQLLIMWCDMLGHPEEGPYFSDRLAQIRQSVAHMDETGLRHGPSEAHIRQIQDWYGQFMANDVNEYNLLSSRMFRAMEKAVEAGYLDMADELARIHQDACIAEIDGISAEWDNAYLPDMR